MRKNLNIEVITMLREDKRCISSMKSGGGGDGDGGGGSHKLSLATLILSQVKPHTALSPC